MTTVLQIQTIVADHYGVRLVHLRSRDRTRAFAWPRQVAMYFAFKITDLNYREVGKEFDRDHGTVIHAIKQVENQASVESVVRQNLECLEHKIADGLCGQNAHNQGRSVERENLQETMANRGLGA